MSSIFCNPLIFYFSACLCIWTINKSRTHTSSSNITHILFHVIHLRRASSTKALPRVVVSLAKWRRRVGLGGSTTYAIWKQAIFVGGLLFVCARNSIKFFVVNHLPRSRLIGIHTNENINGKQSTLWCVWLLSFCYWLLPTYADITHFHCLWLDDKTFWSSSFLLLSAF